LEDAKREGYVVIEDGDVTFGQEAWQNFVDLSSKKIPCKIRLFTIIQSVIRPITTQSIMKV